MKPGDIIDDLVSAMRRHNIPAIAYEGDGVKLSFQLAPEPEDRPREEVTTWETEAAYAATPDGIIPPDLIAHRAATRALNAERAGIGGDEVA